MGAVRAVDALWEPLRLGASTARNRIVFAPHTTNLAARHGAAAGLDGLEVNAGQFSLVRQFLSGLTNQRGDAYGEDRLRFAREVLGAVRREAGRRLVGLRLSCDELAPWAGITPEAAPALAAALAPEVDYVSV